MNRHRFSLLAIPLLVLLAVVSPIAAQTGEDAAGQAAEQAGKLREAVTHYVTALQSTTDGSEEDQRLREKIIKLVLRLDPPPAVPDEARRFAVRGLTAVEEAKGDSEIADAAREFSKALRIAPWWAETYYKLAAVEEKLGHFDVAIRNLKFYLIAAPNTASSDKVKDKIYALEYRRDRAFKEGEERRKAEAEAERLEGERQDRERAKQEVVRQFTRLVEGNIYELSLCNEKPLSQLRTGEKVGCNLQEYTGDNWWVGQSGFFFRSLEDGRIGFCSGTCNKDADYTIIGIVQGSRIEDIRWEVHGKRVWIGSRKDWRLFVFSSDRDPDDEGFNPNTRYFYQQYSVRE